MKIIKRYTNRKLYDTERSCYVTLDEIADMVRDGDELQIIDNKSGDDITTVTLAQIVFEEEKRDRAALPLQALRLIIQSPGELLQRISRPVTDLRDETQRQVEKLRKRAEAQSDELRAPFREFVDNMQRGLDDFQQRLDDRMRDAVDAMTHVPELYDRIEMLESRLARTERELARIRAATESLRSAHESRDVGRKSRVPAPTDPLTGSS